jgi:hypothetical protein
MPWVKMEHAEVFVNPVPTCGQCGRVLEDPQYNCGIHIGCPYDPAPPGTPDEASVPVQGSESQITQEAVSEPAPEPAPESAPAEPAPS